MRHEDEGYMLTEVLVMLAVIVFISVIVFNTAGMKGKLNFFDKISVVVITTAVIYFGYQIFWR